MGSRPQEVQPDMRDVLWKKNIVGIYVYIIRIILGLSFGYVDLIWFNTADRVKKMKNNLVVCIPK